MKHIDTWITEKAYKRFKKKAQKMGATNYKTAQTLIMKGLEKERQEAIGLTITFWFLVYSLISTVIVFVF